MGSRTYTDEQLTAAVASASSWRGVLRELGLKSTSAAAMRSVRRAAADLALDSSHFHGQRRWSDQALVEAIAASRTWAAVADQLGLRGGSWQSTLRGHAARLEIDVDHLERRPLRSSAEPAAPDQSRLGRAGPMMAAAWFTLCGYDVAWPLEPCRYDLLVSRKGSSQRVQVKTTNVRAGDSWTVWISTSGGRRRVYGPDEIDAYFVIDGEMNFYLIPYAAAGGRQTITLGGYAGFRVQQLPPGQRKSRDA